MPLSLLAEALWGKGAPHIFTTDTSPSPPLPPPVSALGIAEKWKTPSFFPCVLHPHGPSLLKWPLQISYLLLLHDGGATSELPS